MLVLDNLALVERAMENLAHGGWGPAAGALARGGDAFRVEPLGNASDAEAPGIHVENLSNQLGFSRIHDAEHMQPVPFGREDFVIVVAVDLPTRDMAGLGFPEHRVIGALLRPFSLHLRREARERQQHLVERRIERPFSVFENSVDLGNPANPINRINPNNPFNSINEVNPNNPLNPITRYNPDTPFQPLR